MTPRRKQIIPSFTQKPADDELNSRERPAGRGQQGEAGMEGPVGSCAILRYFFRSYKSLAAPLRLGERCKYSMIVFLPHVWQKVRPLSSSRSQVRAIIYQINTRSEPDEIVFCLLCSATLRRITRAVPRLSS
jgi:hypothetical protein